MEKRQELHDARRQRPWQHLTSLGVLFGLVFTAGGLIYTAKTWETGQETLRTTQQQQITDRYTKAVEQIGSDKSVEVRIGGLYALERIAKDSPPDVKTVRQVVLAFILERDRLTESLTTSEDARWKPGADVESALRVLGALPRISVTETPPLTATHFESADWQNAYLTGADLRDTNLRNANLRYANLRNARLGSADLTSADLTSADLTSADLTEAILLGADLANADLIGANLSHAVLTNVNHTVVLTDADLTNAKLFQAALPLGNLEHAFLIGADLTAANLAGANLKYADLSGANLTGTLLAEADLRGANLTGVKGQTPEKIRKVATTDNTTRF